MDDKFALYKAILPGFGEMRSDDLRSLLHYPSPAIYAVRHTSVGPVLDDSECILYWHNGQHRVLRRQGEDGDWVKCSRPSSALAHAAGIIESGERVPIHYRAVLERGALVLGGQA